MTVDRPPIRRLRALSTTATVLLGLTTACRRDRMAEDAALSPDPVAPRAVSFPSPGGGVVHGNVYGTGDRGVVLAHGARFDKESWDPQARELAREGFRVLAFDFRGYGESKAGSRNAGPYDGLELDVLAAVRYLRREGAESVSVVGGSMGGGAAAESAVACEDGEIDRLVLLAHSPIEHPERMKGRKLFLVARGDAYGSGEPRLTGIREQYERAPEPKELVVLEGSAHAQWLFRTDQGKRVMREIVRFLEAP